MDSVPIKQVQTINLLHHLENLCMKAKRLINYPNFSSSRVSLIFITQPYSQMAKIKVKFSRFPEVTRKVAVASQTPKIKIT
jgi:hypothetical protein